MKHVMLDIETLGTKPGSLILSIGAAAFDPCGHGVADTFHMAIKPADAQRRGLTIDADTVMWWFAPERAAARGAWLALPQAPLAVVLDGFRQWLDRFSVIDARAIWGNGANFDNVLLRSAYEACGLAAPWSYRADHCFRTMKKLAPDVGPFDFSDRSTMVEHDALTDAIEQAYWLQKIVAALGVKSL